MTYEELVKYQYPLMEEIPESSMVHYVVYRNGKIWVQRTYFGKKTSEHEISEIENWGDFAYWLSAKQLQELNYYHGVGS